MYTLGASGLRWSTVYAATGTINTSDKRLKRDIEPVGEGLSFINQLEPVKYRWKDQDQSKIYYGFLAQDVEAVAPERDLAMIDHDEESDRYGLRYTEFIAPIVQAIKELYEKWLATDEVLETHEREIQSLKEQNQRLEEINTRLMKRLDQIESQLEKTPSK